MRRYRTLPADAEISIHVHSDDLSAPTMEEIARVLIGLGQVIVGAWNVARLILSGLSKMERAGARLVAAAGPARLAYRPDTLDLVLMSLGTMLVGMGTLLAGMYL